MLENSCYGEHFSGVGAHFLSTSCCSQTNAFINNVAEKSVLNCVPTWPKYIIINLTYSSEESV